MDQQRQERIDRILDLYFSRIAPGGMPADLEAAVREWFREGDHLEEKYNALESAFEKHIGYKSRPSEEAVKAWLETMRKLGLPVSDEILASVRRPARSMRLRRVVSRVAAVLLPAALIVGGYFIFDSSRGADGFMAETVPTGVSLRRVVLPDSTVVWLRSGAVIEHPEKFGRQRNVRLTGEAFFEVAENKSSPFVVAAGEVLVRVTGTEFNVNTAAQTGEHIHVTLHSGSVKVKTDGGWTGIEPGEQLGYHRATGQTSRQVVDLSEHDWRNRELNFSDATLSDIFRAIEKAYGIPFQYNTGFSDEKYMVSFAPGEDLRVVLSILRSITGEFDFQITSEKVIINKPQ